MRLIDAEALENEILLRVPLTELQVNSIKFVINKAPTIKAKSIVHCKIKAKPVVHAHWEEVITVIKKIHEYEQEDIQYRCDHCGHIADDFENYCGGCGAQMFEGVKIPVISMEDVPKIMEEKE